MKICMAAPRSPELFFTLLFSALLATGFPSHLGLMATQENSPPLRVNVGLVLVEVTVSDSKGRPMIGLRKEDFRILQDDKEQQISTFEAASEEMGKASLPASLSDIDENNQRGKVVLLLFDQSTISAADSKLALDAAEQYVRQHMHPYDLMGVAVYVQSIRTTCPLTHDSAKVIEAIRHANEAFAGKSGREVLGVTGAKELRSQALDVFRNLKGLCSSLEPVRGRKAILMFTEDMSAPADLLAEFDSLVAGARRSGISFFTLDARGRSESAANIPSLLDTNVEARPTTPPPVGTNLAQFQNQTTPTILRSLANQTDGYPVYGTDDLSGALGRVDAELSHYYILGFQSGNVRSYGKPHKIEVKLNVKDAKLKYRDTFTEPNPADPLAASKGETSLRSALSASTPATQLPVQFRAVYFYENPQVSRISIFVRIGRGSIPLKKRAGQWMGNASVMGVALAEDGTMASRFSGEIKIVVGNAEVGAFKNQDLIYRNFFRLRPGNYRLKLAVMDEKGKTGTAEQNLSIPMFRQGSITSSSLIISQEMVPLPGLIKELPPQMLSQADPMQFRGLQIFATVHTEIDSMQPMLAFYRIYTTAGNARASFKVNAKAIDEEGESHVFPPIDVDSSALQISQNETAIGIMLPCRDLKPGKYHLQVETTEIGGGQSVATEADFQLRGTGREPVKRSSRIQSSPAQIEPASDPATQMADSHWAPPDIDQNAYPVRSDITCPLPDILAGAGKRIQELIHNIDRFTATEVLEHQDVDRQGNLQAVETRKFEYMVSIRESFDGLLEVEETRNRDFSPPQFPGQLATIGTPSIVLIFHPRYSRDFDMVCEGLSEWEGKPAWLIRFEQRRDRTSNIRYYRVAGTGYDVRLRGRAWIRADTFQVVRLETNLAEQIPKIQLRLEHLRIQYHPVDFPERNVQLWLPESAELYVDFRGHRFRRRHYFTDFKMFSVETKQEFANPQD